MDHVDEGKLGTAHVNAPTDNAPLVDVFVQWIIWHVMTPVGIGRVFA